MIAADTPAAATAIAPTLRDKEIARLQSECDTLRAKRRGIENALAFREQKLNRLKSLRALSAVPTPALHPDGCFA